jgi:hypothetical protein
MSATYTYSVSGDFPNGVVSIPSLTMQIDDSTITSSALEYINVGVSAPDNCDIVFAAALSGAEVTTLNGIVATHTGVPPYTPPASEFGWTTVVISASVGTPPSSPATGDTYVIPAGATGVWAGHAQQFTSWNGSAWEFMLPPNGYATWVDDVNQVYVFNNSTWEPLDHFLPLATETDSGLMSAADKVKLDGTTKNDVVSVYDNTGGISFTGTAVTVAFDTTQTNTNETLYTFASNQITVNATGTYLLTYNVSLDAVSSSARSSSRVWLERNTVLVPGTAAFGYHRQSSQGEDTPSCTTVLSITAGDVFRVRAQVESGTSALITIADASRLTITRLA